MEYNKIKIADRIIDERKKKKWSQMDLINELSEKGVKVGRNTISRIESANHDFSNFNLDLLIALSDLFECEIGYLLCEYDCPTGRNTDIQKETGLSNDAINGIVMIRSESENWKKNVTPKNTIGYDDIHILNFLLKHSSIFSKILRGFQNLINMKYRIPVYFNQKENKFIVPSSGYDVTQSLYIENNKYSEIRWLNLAQSENNPNDTIPIPLTNDFFESIALKNIEKTFLELRKLYIENSPDTERK